MSQPDSPEVSPSAAALAGLLDACADLIALSDAEGRLLWANRPFRATAGDLSHLRELPIAHAADLVHRACAARMLAPVDVLLSGRDARDRVAELRVEACETHPGQPGLRWILADVTALRDTQREARRHAELLEMAQEFGRLGVWERDIASGHGHWDRHVFGFWGLDPDGGTPTFPQACALIHPEDRARVEGADYAGGIGHFAQRYRVIGGDGVTRWIHSQWQVKAGPDGRPHHVIGIMMDDTEVYRLANSLGDTSAQLKLAVDLGNIAIWRHDLTTDRMYYNDRAFAVLDIAPRPEGLTLAEVRALIHPDDLPVVVASARRALQTDRPTDMEARYRRADGSWRYVLTRRVVQRSSDGTPLAFVGVALDVTEQVEQQRKAAELTRRLEIAAESAQIGIWSADPARGGAIWNAKMFELCGRDPALGAPAHTEWLEAIVHPDDRARMRLVRPMLPEGPAPMVEHRFRIVRPDGQVRWLVNRASRETWNGGPMIFGVTLDVTEQHLAEMALRSADQLSALAARGAGIGTWEFDLLHQIERWDEQMFRLRNLEPAPRPPSREERMALVHPDDRGHAHPGALDDGRTMSYEFRIMLPDGGVRWLASRSTAVRDENGSVVGRVGVNWDVSEARQAENARREKALAERESKAKSEFLARMSHELRTPLNAVLGFAQLLQIEVDGGSAAGRRAKLGHIRSAGEHLLELIDDVLDLSRLESGQMRLEFATVSLRQLVDEVLPLVQGLALAQRVEVRARSVHGLVRADRTRMLQVLINLLTNAIKYNQPGGVVDIEALPQGPVVSLTVRDSGRGLSSTQLAHLFEPFNRLGVERERVEGSGIGLTIVKALVESMAGTIAASSEPGLGTRFTVTLPAERDGTTLAPTRTPLAELPPAPGARAGNGTILYVEDNPVNVTLVEELVRSFTDLEIICEPDGTRGVARALDLRPDLVLIDMQLPDFDGLEVLRRLRADARTAAIPCIALSANAMPEDIARALGGGFADYWTKPIVFKDFVASLQALFPAAPAPRPN